MKPYNLEVLKAKKPIITEVDIAQWKDIILANVKAEATWLPFVNENWKPKGEANRGFLGVNAGAKAITLERLLAFIASYSPSYTFREITSRCKSLDDVWNIIRRWAGVRASCAKQLTYTKLKIAFDPSGNQSHQEFFFQLRDAKEDCLITAASEIKFNGEVLAQDEVLTPCLESDIVLDWLQAIGGVPLVDHVFRVFSKELEKTSLSDLQERISDTLATLITESETAGISRASIQGSFIRPRQGRQQPPRRDQAQGRNRPFPRSGRPFPGSPARPDPNKTVRFEQNKLCRLCKAEGRPNFASHNISDCWSLTPKDQNSLKIRSSFTDDMDRDEEEYELENQTDQYYDDEEEEFETETQN